MSEVRIPVFYRFVFTWFDPLIAGWSAYMDFFDPDLVIHAFVPNSKRNPAHDTLFHQHGGLMLTLVFMNIFLLRYTTDVNLWKLFEAGVIISDFALFYTVWFTLSQQGRLGLEALRAEDWGTLAITGFVTIARLCFLFGIGLKTVSKDMKKKRI